MIYLDSAATSLLKPRAVSRAMAGAVHSLASPGRGAHRPAMAAAEQCYRCREDLAMLLGARSPENVVFTFNATHGLNIAIGSLVEKGTRVLISGWEHNSVLRPLHALGAEIKIIDAPLFRPEAFLERAKELLPWAQVVVCTHVSNVFGYILPVYELGEMCREMGRAFIVDASQSAGVLDVNFSGLNADFLACPGHKGLLGPQGTGVLLCKNEAKPLLYGGSGSDSISREMPGYLPDRLEAGTHNVCGIAGLHRGVEYILKTGTDRISRHESWLMKVFLRGLDSADAEFFIGDNERVQSGIVSMRPRRCSCEMLGEALARAGVAVRTGLHCSPLAHQSAGTLDTGTVRFSFSPFISAAQARTAARVTEKILKVM